MNRIPTFVLLLAVITFSCPDSGYANLVISGVVDGDESGAIPKGAELVALQNIPDLSVYSIGRYTNGVSTISQVTPLPAVSLAQGAFFYITGTASSNSFFTDNGFTVGLSGVSVLNINGNDLLSIVLTTGGDAVDTFGLPGQGDTSFYTDSIAYRMDSSQTAIPAGLTDASNFDISDWNDSADFGATFGTFAVQAIPEAGSVLFGTLVCGIMGLTYAGRRMKKASPAVDGQASTEV